MTVKKKVSSALSKASKKADMLGAVLGYVGTFGAVLQVEGVGFVEGLAARHYNAVAKHNVLKIQEIPQRIVQDPNWGGLVMTGIGAAITGTILKYVPSVIPSQTTIANIVAKAGFGLAVGGLAANVVGAMSEASGGSTINGGGSYGGSSQPGATTSGRVGYPRKYMSRYPATPENGQKTWNPPMQ